MEAAMPCEKKTTSLTCLQETVARLGAPNKVPQTKYACIGGSHEPTRQRVEPTLLKSHEDHIAGKEYNSMNHYDLVQQFLKAVPIPDAKTAVEKEWKKLEPIQAWQKDKARSKKKEVTLEAQKDKNKVHFAALMDLCLLKNMKG